MTCGEAFVHRRSFNVPTLHLNCGGEPSVCSKKHFYLFEAKAKKVKVAKKVSRKLLHHEIWLLSSCSGWVVFMVALPPAPVNSPFIVLTHKIMKFQPGPFYLFYLNCRFKAEKRPLPACGKGRGAHRGIYLAYSMALVSRRRLTLIWPGYSSSSSIFLAISRARSTIWSSLTWSGLTMMRTSRPAWMA